jgi:hypothetical protein
VLTVSLSVATLADDKRAPQEPTPGEKRAEKSSPDEIDVTEMANLTVVLRDERGAAIPRAEVMPYAMRMREREGHGFWQQKVYGPPRTALSNEQGEAIIQYPGHVRVGPDIMTTRLVTFLVKHTDFVQKIVHFDLGPDKADVTLEPGCEVELSAVDTDRNSIEGFGVLMAGPYASELWADGKEGARRSRSLKDGTWQTMLVKLQKEEGPTLFSDVLALRIRSTKRVRFHNIQMRPGSKVRGTLSDNVPRPVKEGYVVSTSAPKPAADSWTEKDPSVLWHEWVEVAPDGSFEFKSLPRSGELQLIAICDGWISSTVSAEPAARTLVAGQVFNIEDDEHSFVVKMEPTGTLEVSLVTEDGKPFTEGQISSWPNQHYLKGGNTLLGRRVRTALQIQNQLLPPDARIAYPDDEVQIPFIRKVGPDGTATLKGLPLGFQQSLSLSHETFVLKGGAERGAIRYKVDSAEPVRQNLVVIPAKR